jgi:hypothetical protein
MVPRPVQRLAFFGWPVNLCLLLVGALLLGLPAALRPGMANEQILSRPDQQLALYGYDPVAYFADDGARLGLAEHEMVYRRLVFRFANAGNMEAFEADPLRYLPAYGGYCAHQAASGFAAAAHPEVYLVLGQRLFLFSSPAARYAFLLEGAPGIAEADARWPQVLEVLAP